MIGAQVAHRLNVELTVLRDLLACFVSVVEELPEDDHEQSEHAEVEESVGSVEWREISHHFRILNCN